jgi:hypothetical protein
MPSSNEVEQHNTRLTDIDWKVRIFAIFFCVSGSTFFGFRAAELGATLSSSRTLDSRVAAAQYALPEAPNDETT